MSGWKIFGIILAGIVLVAAIICCICHCVKKSRKNKLIKGYGTIGTGDLVDQEIQ